LAAEITARTGKDPGEHYQEMKIYAESFKDQGHLDAIVADAQEIVNDALKAVD